MGFLVYLPIFLVGFRRNLKMGQKNVSLFLSHLARGTFVFYTEYTAICCQNPPGHVFQTIMGERNGCG